MIISHVVAIDQNNGIGKNNQLLCHLPDDLKMFKKITMGHHALMGRKTYESIGKPLPGRTFIIVTKDKNYSAPGSHIVHSIESGIELAKKAGEQELMIIGGAEIFRQTIDYADRLYLTDIHHSFDADTFFPKFSRDSYIESEKEEHLKDEKHLYPYTFRVLDKRVIEPFRSFGEN